VTSGAASQVACCGAEGVTCRTKRSSESGTTHARSGLLWFAASLAAAFAVLLALVRSPLVLVALVVAVVGVVAARRWKNMAVAISGERLIVRNPFRTIVVPIHEISEVGLTTVVTGVNA